MATHWSKAVLATVRYSTSQQEHELRLYDADGTNLGYHQYIDSGADFFVDEYEAGQHPPTGAAQATMDLQLMGLNVGEWSKGSLGYEAKVVPR